MEKTSGNKLLVDINVISVTSQLHQTLISNRPHKPLLLPPARSGQKLKKLLDRTLQGGYNVRLYVDKSGLVLVVDVVVMSQK